MIDKLTSLFCRILFAAALTLAFIAIWDKILRLFGWTISGFSYQPGRMFEFSTMLMIIVIALLLRQIRDGLKK